MVEIRENEKIEDLQYNGLQIIQSDSEYRFTTDAVLLANFCKNMKGRFCVEFGTGSGVISILLAAKKNPKKIVAMELQRGLFELAERNVALNGLQDKIEVKLCDLKNAKENVDGLCDAVVCNPPYRKVGSGETQLKSNLAICRHEIKATLSDIVESASGILNNKGTLYLVHQAERLSEITYLCESRKLSVKEILPVCPRPKKEPNLVLVRAVKNGGSGCILHSPMYVCDENGEYSPRAKAWYSSEV